MRLSPVLLAALTVACVPTGQDGTPTPGTPTPGTPTVPTPVEPIAIEASNGTLRASFPAAGGVSVVDHEDAWSVDLTFVGHGRQGAMLAAAQVPAVQQGDRVRFDRGDIVEWYEGRDNGLKQGFDVLSRPDGDGPLRVDLQVGTDLRPVLYHDSQRLNLLDADGKVVVRYDQLVVFDATGAEVDSWMALDCSAACTVSLVVDDAGAAYPLEIDPTVWSPLDAGTLYKNPNGVPDSGAAFGTSISVFNNFAVVGAPNQGLGASEFGAAVVYTLAGSTWGSPVALTGHTPVNGAQFGAAVDIDGTRIVVGAPGEGKAYVFNWDGSSWGLDGTLVGSGDFGSSVAIHGNTVLVGAPTNGGTGAAYVHQYDIGTLSWDAVGASITSGLATGDLGGTSVAVLGTTAVVGAPGGSLAQVYTYDGLGWTLDATLTGSPTEQFGQSVDIDLGTIAVGAPESAASGGAYLYLGSGASWAQSGTKREPPTGTGFGTSVAVHNETLVVGGPTPNPGHVFIYENLGTTAKALDNVSSPNSLPRGIGTSVSVHGVWVLIGAPTTLNEDDDDERTGAFIAFEGDELDADGDGFAACASLFPHLPAGCDCDDNNVNVNPNGTELDSTENIDENCDNLVVTCGVASTGICGSPPTVLVSELMLDPLTDDRRSGQWVELRNSSNTKVDLFGAYLFSQASQQGNRQSPINQTLVVGSGGGRAVVAGSDDPSENGGLTPDAVFWPGFYLDYNDNNTASSIGLYQSDTLDVTPVLIPVDDVQFNPQTFTSSGVVQPGVSVALHSGYANTSTGGDNDLGSRWCESRTPMGGGAYEAQFGTPGAVNDACQHDFDMTFLFEHGTIPAQDYEGGPINVEFRFCEGSLGCGPFGLSRWFTTSNQGLGTYAWTMGSGGLELAFQFSYYEDHPTELTPINPTPGPIYLGNQSFGQSCVIGGEIDLSEVADPMGFVDGIWLNEDCP